MRVHRTAHERDFTVIPNDILRHCRLTFGARGLLGHLIGQADGTRIDIRILADANPEGRQGIANLLNELKEHGYYRIVRRRTAEGKIITETHVYDTPQTAAVDTEPEAPAAPADPPEPPEPPSAPPGSGAAPSREAVAPLRGKNQGEKPSLPARAPDEQLSDAARLLYRAVGRNPRLRLGAAEAAELAPLVEAWLERGATERDLRHALLDGLPARIFSAAGLLRNRLTRKLPPAPEVEALSARHDCARCERPGLSAPGICRSCAGLPDASPPPSRPLLGPALARAALHGRLAVP